MSTVSAEPGLLADFENRLQGVGVGFSPEFKNSKGIVSTSGLAVQVLEQRRSVLQISGVEALGASVVRVAIGRIDLRA